MKYFLIVLSILLLIGGGVLVWFFVRDDAPADSPEGTPTTSESSTEEPTESEESTESGEESSSLDVSGTFNDLVAYGQPVMCTWRASDEAGGQLQEGRGTFYTDGVSRGRAEATYTIDSVTVPIEGVFVDNQVYYWQTVGGTTLGFLINTDSFDESSEALTPEEQASAIDIRSNYDFDCQPWSVDESMFALPEGVEFISL